MTLTTDERNEKFKKIAYFVQSSLHGITIPLPTYLTDDEIDQFIDFIDYCNGISCFDDVYKQKRNNLIEKMTEHFKIVETITY